MENNQPKKKNAGLTALIALLLVITTVASCIGIYAWAKYITSQSGNATAEIAKWNFNLKLNKGDGVSTDTAGPIDLADTIDFTHVKSGTIAPGTNGQFQVIIDTTGTEVDLQYDVTIAISNCPRNITFSRVDENNVTTVLSAGGASNNSRSRTLSFSKYLHAKPTNENGRHVETITWNWPYSSNADENWDARDNEDNGLQVTMNITARGTEMLSDQSVPAADSVQAQAQSGAINRWDSVNYNPGTLTTASIELPDGTSIEGSKLASINLPSGVTLSGTISATEASDWVVLDVNQSTGEVKIIPRTYSSKNLTLNGMNGYNKAIQALNEVASIYLNPSYATSSRSLTVDDVNGVEGRDPTGAATGSASGTSSGTASGNGEVTHSWSHRYGMDENLNIVDYGEGNEEERTYVKTPATGYYSYNTENFGNWNCWLASRCVYLNSDTCDFNVRILYSGSVHYDSLFGVTSDGIADDYSNSYPVVPVVTLKSTVHMDKDSNGVWQLSL